MNVREATALAAHVAAKSTTLPILGYLRIAGGRIQATDLSQQIDIPIALPASLAKADFCVHAARLMRVLNALPPELELDLQHRNGTLIIKAGPTRYELKTLAAEDYPLMAADPEEGRVQFR